MRRQHFYWAYLVLAVVLTVYGVYSIIYSVNHEKEIPVLAITFASIGVAMLLIFAVLYLVSIFQKKKRRAYSRSLENDDDEDELELEEEVKEEPQKEEKIIEEPKPVEELEEATLEDDSDDEVVFERVRPSGGFRGGSAYINKVGYGPVLRVNGPQIVDMRNNTYYRIEDNIVYQDGSGPVFEISGNKIKAAFGSYLYEISGNSVNKIFGGFYASINSGNIQIYDLSERYEISDSLNLSQQLAVVAILFGSY